MTRAAPYTPAGRSSSTGSASLNSESQSWPTICHGAGGYAGPSGVDEEFGSVVCSAMSASCRMRARDKSVSRVTESGAVQTHRITSRVATSEPRFIGYPSPAPDAPNVLIVVLDDVGFAQLGCFGAGFRTPNIDRVAGEGLRYNRFPVASVC